MISDDKLGHSVSYWPSVSDLFMTLFIISVALVGVVVLVLLPSPNDDIVIAKIRNEFEQRIAALQAELEEQRCQLEASQLKVKETTEKLEKITAELEDATEREKKLLADLNAARERMQNLQDRIVSLQNANATRSDDKPPIITIADADKKHFFASGSATLTPEFVSDLNEGDFEVIASEILKRNQNGRKELDTLEIIGHTDGVPVSGEGNLDSVLPLLLDGDEKNIERLTPGSNNDLGLMRALAIKHAWEEFASRHIEHEQLESIAIRTYSAGQTIPVETGYYRSEDARARRIEIRLTKLK